MEVILLGREHVEPKESNVVCASVHECHPSAEATPGVSMSILGAAAAAEYSDIGE